MELDDVMLMAFADESLPAETAAAVARRVALDPALARKVERFRADRALLRAAFDPVLREPVPERLVRTIRASAVPPISGRPAADPRVVAGDAPGRIVAAPAMPAPAGAQGRPSGRRRRAWLPLALAASVALLLGYGAGRLAGPGSAPPTTLARLAEAPELVAAAEARPTGAGAVLPGQARAVLLGSLRLPDGRFCREAEIAGGGVAGQVLLCRAAPGSWPVAALLAAAPATRERTFEPASGGGDEAPSPIWAAFGGRPLDAAEERAALAAGWR